MSKRQLLEVIEYICLGLTVLGSIAAGVTQQMVYATVPLSLSIALNLINRPRFNSSNSQQIEQLEKTIDTSNQRLQQIESWRQHLNQVIDNKIAISMQKFSTGINNFQQQIQDTNNHLCALDNSSQKMQETVKKREEELETLQKIQADFLELEQKTNQRTELVNSQVSQIEQSFKNWNENGQQQLGKLSQNQENQSLEFTEISQQFSALNSRFETLDDSIQQINQTLSAQREDLHKFKQQQNSKNSQFNHLLDTVNQSLTVLDNSFDALITFNSLVRLLETQNNPDTNLDIQTSQNFINSSFNQAISVKLSSDNDVERLIFARTLKGHKNKVLSVAFSPNDNLLASGSEDKSIKIWDLVTQKHRTFAGHEDDSWFGGVNSVNFSPDGRILASGGNDKNVILWDVMTGEKIVTFTGHEEKVYSVAFSPLGKILASGSKDQTVKIWSLETRKEIYSFKGHNDDVLCVVFSPDGKLLASGSKGNDSTIKILQITENKVRSLNINSDWFSGGINALAFSGDSKFLASCGKKKVIKIWNVETGEENKVLTGHSETVYAVAFSPNGKILASASKDKTVRLWNIENGVEISSVQCGDDAIYDVAFSPDGKILAAGSGDKMITLFPCK